MLEGRYKKQQREGAKWALAINRDLESDKLCRLSFVIGFKRYHQQQQKRPPTSRSLYIGLWLPSSSYINQCMHAEYWTVIWTNGWLSSCYEGSRMGCVLRYRLTIDAYILCYGAAISYEFTWALFCPGAKRLDLSLTFSRSPTLFLWHHPSEYKCSQEW